MSKAGESNIRPGEQNWPSKDNPAHLMSLENVKEDINLGLLTLFFIHFITCDKDLTHSHSYCNEVIDKKLMIEKFQFFHGYKNVIYLFFLTYIVSTVKWTKQDIFCVLSGTFWFRFTGHFGQISCQKCFHNFTRSYNLSPKNCADRFLSLPAAFLYNVEKAEKCCWNFTSFSYIRMSQEINVQVNYFTKRRVSLSQHTSDQTTCGLRCKTTLTNLV